MRHSLLSLMHGYAELSFCCEDRVEIYNLLLRNQIGTFGYRTDGECFSVRVFLSALPILKASLDEKHIQAIYVKKRGLVPVLQRYRMRVGLLLGVIIFTFLVIFSGRTIWDVRVKGNTDISENEIVSALSDVGLSIGTFHSKIDTDAIAIKLLQNKKELSWASINIKGNVAYVEVLEKDQSSAEKNDPIYGANLVAGEDAVVEGIEVVRGKVVRMKGQSVKKGDLLVSGVVEGPTKTSYLQAKGRVMGIVRREITVEIPYECLKKERFEEDLREFSIDFYGIFINIYKDTGNLDTSYDTIYKRDRLSLLGGVPLPIFFEQTVAVQYKNTVRRLTDAEMILAANAALNQRLREVLADGHLLERKLIGEFTPNGYRLTAELVCIQNIAVEQKFKVTE